MGKRPGVMLYFDVRPSLRRLSDEEKGRLFEAILDYGENGVIPAFEDRLGVAWDFIQPKIDADSQRYQKITGSRRDAAYARWHPEKVQKYANADFAMQTIPPTSTSTSTPSPSPKIECVPHPRFVPPTLDEVRAYCLERENQIDPTAFVDYYQARGWKLNGGQAMKDWRAAVRTWEKRERPSGWGKPTKPSAPADFQPSSERIQKSGEWLDQFLASQEQETHHQSQEDHKKEPPSQ